MSLLSGKSKEDFEKYLMSLGCDEYDIIRLSNEEKEYYTIQFLDSVGIYITPQIDYQLNFYFRILLDKKEETPTVIIGHDFKSRSGAIEYGIKKANKIYNER